MTRDNPGERHPVTRATERPTLGEQLGIVRTRSATETEHDEIRRRLEATGGAVFELPSDQRSAAPKAAEVRASERMRVQRAGEPELTLRDGVLAWASGVEIEPDAVPDWARQSIIKAADVLHDR